MRGVPYEAYQVDSERLATAFVEVADAAVRGGTQALGALVGSCVSLLGVASAVAVLNPPAARVEVAASDPRGLRLERAALTWGEGPGLDCRSSATAISGVPLAHPYARANWPSYTAMARSLGFACVVGGAAAGLGPGGGIAESAVGAAGADRAAAIASGAASRGRDGAGCRAAGAGLIERPPRTGFGFASAWASLRAAPG
ncbi:hypothetical protein [Streptomyces sp. NPDC102360]|uniref:hypothetical protein n=1 Tax=Streptomyces sp. NPDC102360 TaxID=3366160 RepID=UPI0038246C7A